jgi:hypothetical protein
MVDKSDFFKNKCKGALRENLINFFAQVIKIYEEDNNFTEEIIVKFIPDERLLKHHSINRSILQADGSMTIILKRGHGNNLVTHEEYFQIDIKIGTKVFSNFCIQYKWICALVLPSFDLYIDFGNTFKEIDRRTLSEDNIIVHDFAGDNE